MAVRVPRRRSQTPRSRHDYFLGLTRPELFGYLLAMGGCVAIGWILAVVN